MAGPERSPGPGPISPLNASEPASELAIAEEILAAVAQADRPALVLSDGGSGEDPASPDADLRIQVLVDRRDLSALLEVAEPLPWQYAWAHEGILRIVPTRSYWFAGGHELEIYHGLAAAPLPSVILTRVRNALWRNPTARQDGLLDPDPSALLIHRVVQWYRSDGDAAEWRLVTESLDELEDWGDAEALGRDTGTHRALARARRAWRADRGGPAPRPSGSELGPAWRLATSVSRRLRHRRLGRLLQGAPKLGDATLRCRVAGVEVRAEAGVFVPTPDATDIADLSLAAIEHRPSPIIVEAGAGCGAIALAVAAHRPDADVHATELADLAVASMHRNVRRLGLSNVAVYAGSVLTPLPAALRGTVDLVIANLPFYPATRDASVGSISRDTVLGTGADGLDLVRQLAVEARPLLRPGGRLLLQMFGDQWDRFVVELEAMGYIAGEAIRPDPFAIGSASLPLVPLAR